MLDMANIDCTNSYYCNAKVGLRCVLEMVTYLISAGSVWGEYYNRSNDHQYAESPTMYVSESLPVDSWVRIPM